MGTVNIRRSTLASPDAARLIAALNAEPKATFPEHGNALETSMEVEFMRISS